MKKLLLSAIILICLSSCKTHINTAYKVKEKTTNYYTEQVYLDYATDSIFFVEFKRNGEVRRKGAFPVSQVIVEEKK